MNHVDESRNCVAVPCVPRPDFAMTYEGKSLPSIGLMTGDVILLRSVSGVSDVGSCVVVRDGEHDVLGRLWERDPVMVFAPADIAIESRVYSGLGNDLPCIIGEVTGWIHSLPCNKQGVTE